ncbi:MAG: CBS domain-containing protein [Thermoplasmatales archaeon]|jgi:CBS domain-containing protein|nr:CBS domain-containing protein [Candidatus Thermoplasmatota archaeon]MCL6002885.1 CBS domain-containing protein [Candidatus Thermoplasmatota archaeon]MDA8056275.1 CBS domain-containing protein [Thermoplasmatales archaeon]
MNFIQVSEVMSRNPIKVKSSLTVEEGAKIMAQKGISSLLVEDQGQIVGIVTERDIVTKIAANGMSSSEKKLSDVMSSPLIHVEGGMPLETAAEMMWKKRIRRLPVMINNEIVGILTENDIVRISPGLIEITRGILDSKNQGIVKGIHGVCDSCNEFSENLIYKAGSYYCERCYSENAQM